MCHDEFGHVDWDRLRSHCTKVRGQNNNVIKCLYFLKSFQYSLVHLESIKCNERRDGGCVGLVPEQYRVEPDCEITQH